MPAPIARAWRRSERRRAFAARRASPQRDRAPSVMAATFARRFRPGDEIVDMVEDIACVAAEGGAFAAPSHPLRSEEHTSELQSLMRISYAVFCLKKKKQTKPQQYENI